MNKKAPHDPNEMVLNWARSITTTFPTIYDKNRIWWLWNFRTYQYEETDETELLNNLRGGLNLGDIILLKETHIIRALKLLAREQQPPELPPNKIQFKNKVFDLETGDEETIFDEQKETRPKYFTTNSIPHPLGEIEATPTLDKLFTEWVGKENVATLYELIAYCAYRQYPIHIIAVLNGSGRNGKSSFLKVLEKFLGEHNLASTDFERLITNRFETYNLYRKLGAIMGETSHAVLKNSSLIKRLSGDDLVQYEKKGGATIEAHSYATLLVATNSLPISEDETEGFYRRWIIIDFPNEFPEGKDITQQIPFEEFRNLARKITKVLPELLAKGKFTNQGSIDERREAYISASNPFIDFVKERCDTHDPNAYVIYRHLYQAYLQYLHDNKKRRISKPEFSKVLDNLGYDVRETTLDDRKDTYVFGAKLGNTLFQFGQEKPSIGEVGDIDDISLSPNITPYRVNLTDMTDTTDLARETPEFRGEYSGNNQSAIGEHLKELVKAYGKEFDIEKLKKQVPPNQDFDFEEWLAKQLREGILSERKKGFVVVV